MSASYSAGSLEQVCPNEWQLSSLPGKPVKRYKRYTVKPKNLAPYTHILKTTGTTPQVVYAHQGFNPVLKSVSVLQYSNSKNDEQKGQHTRSVCWCSTACISETRLHTADCQAKRGGLRHEYVNKIAQPATAQFGTVCNVREGSQGQGVTCSEYKHTPKRISPGCEGDQVILDVTMCQGQRLHATQSSAHKHNKRGTHTVVSSRLTNGAGPRTTLPSLLYWLPWHGHLNLFSFCISRQCSWCNSEHIW